MVNHNRKRIPIKSILCMCLTLACLLSCIGCSGSTTQELPSEAGKSTTISFSWWGNDERHQYTLKGIHLFENQENIKVMESYGVWDGYELRNKIQMNAKTNADVMQINYSWLSTYSGDGTGYYDLSTLSDVIDFSQFSEEDLAIGTVNGHLNALPIAYNMSVMYFNETLFASYGLPVPKTWDDLFAAAKVMKEDGLYPLGTVKKHLFLIMQAYFEQSTGRSLFDQEGNLTASTEDLQLMLTFYKRLIDEKVLMPIDEYGSNSFQNRKVAGVACWISDASVYSAELQEKGNNIVQADLLGLKESDTKGWYIKPATLYAIRKDTKHPQEAGELVNFLLNNEEMAILQGTEKGVPVSRAAFSTLQENNMLNTLESDSTNYLNEHKDKLSVILPIMEATNNINGFKNVGDKYIYSQATLEECAAELMEIMKQ